ncbi:MAG: myo-inositol-1-phosphate synthase, partial [Planctomycetaceae bacterium]|nr:myo-inositol-1-phosphate synthase [Planctomycetaceae bacterium]
MSERKIGIWFIGAWGGVATTSVIGLAALQKGIAPQTGLVTELSLFQKTPFAGWDQFVVGGHEVRQIGFRNAAQELVDKSNLF